jgi:hypothetical protein
VKTTPNPKATKNNSGELVGPGLLLLLVVEAALVAAEAPVEVNVAVAGIPIVMEYFFFAFRLNEGVFRN